ncbi:MAG: DUF397 domain-containing protein [Actinomycetota bacterium]|nr:DUF397 domain-containing protein [Actinomycetota bacterium]
MTIDPWQAADFRKSSFSGGANGSCVELAWRKSSFSGGASGSCVELAWHKSSFSGGQNGACVEIAQAPDLFGIRDSKNVTGPVLEFGSTPGHALVAALRDDRLTS